MAQCAGKTFEDHDAAGGGGASRSRESNYLACMRSRSDAFRGFTTTLPFRFIKILNNFQVAPDKSPSRVARLGIQINPNERYK